MAERVVKTPSDEGSRDSSSGSVKKPERVKNAGGEKGRSNVIRSLARSVERARKALAAKNEITVTSFNGERASERPTPLYRVVVTGSVNEAGVFALRGRQEGNRRSRRTTTSTTSTTTSDSTLIPLPDEVAQPAALLAPEEESWSISSSTTTNVPLPSDTAATSANPPLELVVKPHSKVILPCELEGNYSRLLLPGAR